MINISNQNNRIQTLISVSSKVFNLDKDNQKFLDKLTRFQRFSSQYVNKVNSNYDESLRKKDAFFYVKKQHGVHMNLYASVMRDILIQKRHPEELHQMLFKFAIGNKVEKLNAYIFELVIFLLEAKQLLAMAKSNIQKESVNDSIETFFLSFSEMKDPFSIFQECLSLDEAMTFSELMISLKDHHAYQLNDEVKHAAFMEQFHAIAATIVIRNAIIIDNVGIFDEHYFNIAKVDQFFKFVNDDKKIFTLPVKRNLAHHILVGAGNYVAKKLLSWTLTQKEMIFYNQSIDMALSLVKNMKPYCQLSDAAWLRDAYRFDLVPARDKSLNYVFQKTLFYVMVLDLALFIGSGSAEVHFSMYDANRFEMARQARETFFTISLGVGMVSTFFHKHLESKYHDIYLNLKPTIEPDLDTLIENPETWALALREAQERSQPAQTAQEEEDDTFYACDFIKEEDEDTFYPCEVIKEVDKKNEKEDKDVFYDFVCKTDAPVKESKPVIFTAKPSVVVSDTKIALPESLSNALKKYQPIKQVDDRPDHRFLQLLHLKFDLLNICKALKDAVGTNATLYQQLISTRSKTSLDVLINTLSEDALHQDAARIAYYQNAHDLLQQLHDKQIELTLGRLSFHEDEVGSSQMILDKLRVLHEVITHVKPTDPTHLKKAFIMAVVETAYLVEKLSQVDDRHVINETLKARYDNVSAVFNEHHALKEFIPIKNPDLLVILEDKSSVVDFKQKAKASI